ncbi:hypothetical protein A4X03_0g7916 [Tilletia caries]|uniref:Uncharacterized protein n=1 Tax=Tilletia caries TaxID=13290 RepID=A0A8T8SKZ1_9BASI|nr:hypothetical protein A4X03_0g7916 [Tilletia caries]
MAERGGNFYNIFRKDIKTIGMGSTGLCGPIIAPLIESDYSIALVSEVGHDATPSVPKLRVTMKKQDRFAIFGASNHNVQPDTVRIYKHFAERCAQLLAGGGNSISIRLPARHVADSNNGSENCQNDRYDLAPQGFSPCRDDFASHGIAMP